MKKLYLLVLLIVTFISCDGRYKAKRNHIDALKEAKLFESFSEELKFFPKEYTEIKTDTLLSNGFEIKIDYHSLENDFVIKTSKKSKDTSIRKHFKNFEANLYVLKSNIPIANNTINKSLFYNDTNKAFLDNAIMQYAWIDYNSVTKNSVQLNTSFILPETEKFKDFVITVYDDGKKIAEEINLIENAL